MSELRSLLDQVRSLYTDAFEAELARLRETGGKLIVEPPLLNASGNVQREGLLKSGMRVDVVLVADGKTEKTTISSSRMLNFDALELDGDGVVILLQPFVWDSATVSAVGDTERLIHAFAEWFEPAFAGDEAGNDDLQGAVHFISDPLVEDGRASCEIDFGTAPVDSLMNLINLLIEAGATRMEFGPTPN